MTEDPPTREPRAIRDKARLEGDPLRDFMQVPREWIEKHPEFSWCLDQDQSEHVPEIQRGDNCVYVLKGNWDKRTEG